MLINNTITLNINSIIYCKPAKAYKPVSKLTVNTLTEYNKNIINIIYFFIRYILWFLYLYNILYTKKINNIQNYKNNTNSEEIIYFQSIIIHFILILINKNFIKYFIIEFYI